MLKRTTTEKYCQKRTTPGWRHVWPGVTWHVPPGPTPARGCRLSQRRHVTCRVTPSTAVSEGGPCRPRHRRQVDVAPCRQRHRRHPAMPVPALIPTQTAMITRKESRRIYCFLCWMIPTQRWFPPVWWLFAYDMQSVLFLSVYSMLLYTVSYSK
jgi:hypothetical protein